MAKVKKIMSTYVLEDRVQGIFKIGQSTNVPARLRQLCVPGEIYPVKVYTEEDLEGELHVRFADCRIDNPIKSVGGGYTEWFNPSMSQGGKFQMYIDKLKGERDAAAYPFYTPHALVEHMEKIKKIRMDSIATRNKVIEREYYKFNIGKKIIAALGYLYYTDGAYHTIHKEVSVDGYKTFISNDILMYIGEHFTVDIVSLKFETILQARQRAFGKRLFIKSLDYLHDGTPVYLIVTEL